MSRFDIILALDPGPAETAWCWHCPPANPRAGISPNEDLLRELQQGAFGHGPILAVEWIECMGMAVGREVFETVFWCGKFVQAWAGPWMRVPRREVKLFVCGDTRAKDPNIRQALLDRLGPQGTKAKPGPTYGFKSHCWAAAAVAVTAGAALWQPDGPKVLKIEEPQ